MKLHLSGLRSERHHVHIVMLSILADGIGISTLKLERNIGIEPMTASWQPTVLPLELIPH